MCVGALRDDIVDPKPRHKLMLELGGAIHVLVKWGRNSTFFHTTR